VDVAANMVMQVGQALEHAYRKGVISGSLSPENIFKHDRRVRGTNSGAWDHLGHLVSIASKVPQLAWPANGCKGCRRIPMPTSIR
jgi:hypothetical protein